VTISLPTATGAVADKSFLAREACEEELFDLLDKQFKSAARRPVPG
jgi:hypothetical protein